MSKEFKDRLQEIKQKYTKVNDEFLNLFEKRNIIFIENGVDLKNDCKLFSSSNFSKKGWNHQEKMIKIDINRHIAKNDFFILNLLSESYGNL